MIYVTRRELRTAYFAAPIRDMGEYRAKGRWWKRPSQHTGLEAVARLVAQRCGAELSITDIEYDDDDTTADDTGEQRSERVRVYPR